MTSNPTINQMLDRSLPLLTAEGVRVLGQKRIAIAGCGGVGGAHAITMARMGVGAFNLADPGFFDPPDMNRQWGANRETMGENKAEVYCRQIANISPNPDIKVFKEGVTPDNIEAFLTDANLLLDCLDVSVSIDLRERLHAEARKRGIFIITAPIIGFGCILICSEPEGMSMRAFTPLLKATGAKGAFPPIFKQIFTPSHIDIIGERLATGRVPSLAIAPIIAASLAATESIAFFLHKVLPGSRRAVVLPRIMFFDLYRMSYRIVDGSPFLAKEAQ